MKLKIENFAKIKSAELEFNGLTVIAGNNNTGKSTVGKILFSLFTVFREAAEIVAEQRKWAANRVVNKAIDDYLEEYEEDRKTRTIFERAALSFRPRTAIFGDFEELQQEVRDYIKTETGKKHEGDGRLFSRIKKDIDIIHSIPEIDLIGAYAFNYFSQIFYQQILPLRTGRSKEAVVSLVLRGKSICCTFLNDECKIEKSNIKVQNQAVYIDNPFVVDSLLQRERNIYTSTEEHLLNLLRKEKDVKRVVDEELLRNDMKMIQETLAKVVSGDIIHSNRREWKLRMADMTDDLNVGNLSTGIKSFVLIKRLLENGTLHNRDVLILDEPEIHLHPEWQLIYAQLIILLQKYFDMTILLTTHSPYFLNAIEVYSVKYGVANKCKYYLAENKEGMAEFSDVTSNTDQIYKLMLTPFELLQSMAYEGE